MTIFGIGEWRMRNGGKAVVDMMLGVNPYKLQGHIDGVYCTWTTAGRVFRSREDPHDLVAPWEEPAPDTIDAEMQAWLAKVDAEVKSYSKDRVFYITHKRMAALLVWLRDKGVMQ